MQTKFHEAVAYKQPGLSDPKLWQLGIDLTDMLIKECEAITFRYDCDYADQLPIQFKMRGVLVEFMPH